MKRRAFIVLGGLSVAAIGSPIAKWLGLYGGWDNQLAEPTVLSRLFSRKTLRAFGRMYLELKPNDSDKNILARQLLGETSEVFFSGTSDIQTRIEEKIQQDFNNGQTIVLNGWILSLTEAKQCAYFSLLNS